MHYKENQEWVFKIQPLAISQHYTKIWPRAEIRELDAGEDKLSQSIDIGGGDKMLKLIGGGIAFVGQRFRKHNQLKYDDFTIRDSEWRKTLDALRNGGFIPDYYAYGHVNKDETGFARFRVLNYRSFVNNLKEGKMPHIWQSNKDKYDHRFLVVKFRDIPAEHIIYDTVGKQLGLRING